MSIWHILSVLAVVGMGGVLGAKGASDEGGASPATQSRTLVGHCIEFCSCERVCESVFGDAGRRGPCNTVIAFHIGTGRRADLHLDDLAAVVVAPAPAAGASRAAPTLYVDATARPEQAEAIAGILNERLEARLGAKLGPPKAAKVQVIRNKEVLAIRIEGVADLRARPVVGPYGQTVQIENAGSTLGFPLVGRGVGGQIADPASGVQFDGDGRSVLFGKFDFGPPKGRK